LKFLAEITEVEFFAVDAHAPKHLQFRQRTPFFEREKTARRVRNRNEPFSPRESFRRRRLRCLSV